MNRLFGSVQADPNLRGRVKFILIDAGIKIKRESWKIQVILG